MGSQPGNARIYVKTGISGLDEILLGGVIRGNIIVVEGMPGTGKSSLALEFLYRGVTECDEPGILFSFESSTDKILRDAAGFGWNMGQLERKDQLKIVCTTPLALMDGLQAVDGVLSREIESISAKRVVIDGLAPLRLYAEKNGGRPYRESLQLLMQTLARLDVMVLFTTEMSRTAQTGESDAREEQYLGDTIISLRNQARRRSVHRSIEVVKSRGQDFISGRHALRIADEVGVCVYPRVYARPKSEEAQPTSTERIPSGNNSLDSMMGGGFLKGSVTLVGGISGTGKTIIGMQFLGEGGRRGERSLMVSLDEHPEQLLRNAESLNLEFKAQHDKGHIILHYDSPLEVDLDEHFYTIKELVEKNKIQRVVIDSVAAYDHAQPEEAREFLVSLATFFKSRLITAFFNFECPELLGLSQINDQLKSSAIVDNIMLLNYIEISTMIRRAITIPKSRGSKPDQWTREYVIEQGGINILDDKSVEGIERVPQLPLSSYYGVLARGSDAAQPSNRRARRSRQTLAQIADAQDLTESQKPLNPFTVAAGGCACRGVVQKPLHCGDWVCGGVLHKPSR